MNLLDIVVQDAINTDLTSDSRNAAIGELLDMLVKAGKVKSELRDDFQKAIIKRENKGSTGFGHGVAVPHIKHEQVEQMAVAIGICREGLDFKSLDGQPVHSVFLLLSPEDRPSEHLEAMEAVFGNLSQETFRKFLFQATTTEDVVTLLGEADASKLNT
ncbi:MAG: PTS fructose transporter subunit IIA [Phycisphaerae bacterium]|nr:PTS fructose transporter subunit IIA [Phycisphaerae bacterium]